MRRLVLDKFKNFICSVPKPEKVSVIGETSNDLKVKYLKILFPGINVSHFWVAN